MLRAGRVEHHDHPLPPFAVDSLHIDVVLRAWPVARRAVPEREAIAVVDALNAPASERRRPGMGRCHWSSETGDDKGDHRKPFPHALNGRGVVNG